MSVPYFTGYPANWVLEIAKGNIDKHTLVHVYGRNTDIDLAAAEDVWDGGGVWVAPTIARVHNIVSTDTNDDGAPVGTGARTISVSGLDSNGDEQSETIILNGTTNVPTVNSYTIIHEMIVLTVGSNGSNAGVITATAVTDATVSCQINAAKNKSFLGIYQIPTNKTAYILNFHSAIMSSDATVVTSSLLVQPTGGVFTEDHVLGISDAKIPADTYIYTPIKQISAQSIIKMQSSVSANNTDIFGRFGLIIVG
jgi:hypothetical protein